MADRDRPPTHQIQIHPQRGGAYSDAVYKGPQSQRGPSASQILAVVTLLPVGGTLLGLAGLILAGTLIGLALTTPLFLICSPVLVPAAALMGLAVFGFLSSGAFGLSGLSSLSWVLNSFRQNAPEGLDYAKQRLQDTAMTVGQKTKEVGEKIQTKAQESGRETTGTGTGRDVTAK